VVLCSTDGPSMGHAPGKGCRDALMDSIPPTDLLSIAAQVLLIDTADAPSTTALARYSQIT
jgi:hypothetical protein